MKQSIVAIDDIVCREQSPDAMVDQLLAAEVNAAHFYSAYHLLNGTFAIVLSSIFGRDVTFTRATFDDYDDSFELFQFEPYNLDPTADQLALVGKLGFAQFWLHRGPVRVYDNEVRRTEERIFTTRWATRRKD